MMLSVVSGVLAVLLLALHVQRRLGRTEPARRWSHGTAGRRRQLTVVPALVCLLGALALAAPAGAGSDAATVVAAVLVLLMLIFTAVGALSLPLPRWYLPGWMREARRPRPGNTARHPRDAR